MNLAGLIKAIMFIAIGWCLGWFSYDFISNRDIFSENKPISESLRDNPAKTQLAQKPFKNYSTVSSDNKKNREQQAVKPKITQKKPWDKFKDLLAKKNYAGAIQFYAQLRDGNIILKCRKLFLDYADKNRGDPDVKGLLERYVAAEPEDIAGFILLAKICSDRKDYQNAIKFLRTAKNLSYDRQITDAIDKGIYSAASMELKRLEKDNNHSAILLFLQNLTWHHPEQPYFFYTLALQYEKLEMYNDGILALSGILYDPVWGEKASALTNNLKKQLELAKRYIKKIELIQKNEHFFVNAKINDRHSVALLIDTGASVTGISSESVNALGIVIDEDAPKAAFNTAGGRVEASLITVESFSVDDFVLEDMRLAILDFGGIDGADGLLGMNYLKHFDFYIDQEKRLMHISPK